jgi:ABC-type nitrate/sulfonate/bicarbonate transport system substrate-binding protein
MRVFFGILIVVLSLAASADAQERRRIRISNATLSYSALPLVAAREWNLFQEQGLDVKIILMRSGAVGPRWFQAISTISRESARRVSAQL